MVSPRDEVIKAYLKLAEGKKPGLEFPVEERQAIGRATASTYLHHFP